MGRQEAVFLAGEGDAWFVRNQHKSRDSDPVLKAIQGLEFDRALEVGCGNGLRLAKIKERGFKRDCLGIDPSSAAIHAGRRKFRHIDLMLGTANNLPDYHHDLIIYGFCLYLCDRSDLPLIVSQGDSRLVDDGHLVIHDFDPEYPHKVPYHHVPGLYSYKMDYSKLWLANPSYSLVHKEVIGDGTAVWVLKKDIAAGWPEEAAP